MKLKIKLKSKKFFLSLIAIALLSAGCGGGATPQNQPVILNFWKTFEDSQNMQALISAYTEKNPNVQIVYTKKNIENYSQDLLNALAAGTGPDIFSIHNSWLPEYADKLAPADEKSFIFKDYKDAFVDVAVSDFTKEGKIYAVPLAVDSMALFYNKDLLGTAGIAVPPKTWAELAAQVQKLKKNDGKGYFTRSGAALGLNKNINRAADILYLFMLQAGARSFSQDGLNPAFSDSIQKNGNTINPGQIALSFFTSFANPATPNYNWNLRSDYSIDAFANGRAAFLFSYAYTRDTLLQKNPNLNFDVAPVPQPNLEDPAVNFANYWGEAVSKQSKHQQAAWDFLKFISSKEALDKYYAQHKQPSSRKDLIELQTQDPQIGVFAHANLTAKPFYRPSQTKMDDIFGRMIDSVILNGVSVEEALSLAVQQAGTINREY